MNAFVLIAPFHHLEVVEVGENFQEIDKGKTGVYIRIIYICVLYYIYVGKVYALVRNRPAAVSYGISKIKRKRVTLLD